jgi:hypothetical protein
MPCCINLAHMLRRCRRKGGELRAASPAGDTFRHVHWRLVILPSEAPEFVRRLLRNLGFGSPRAQGIGPESRGPQLRCATLGLNGSQIRMQNSP